MAKWSCVQNCGACCFLDPSERPDLETYLSPEELQQYLAMVSETGWCVHYDRETRECRIYRDRPQFCRVSPENFARRYEIDLADFDEFAIDCCYEHIIGLYGEESQELQRFETATNS